MSIILCCVYKAKFLILEGRSFARYLQCNCMVVYRPYSIWSGQYYWTYTPKRSLTCGAQSMFSDRSGLAEVGWDLVGPSQLDSAPPLALPVGHRSPSKANNLRKLFLATFGQGSYFRHPDLDSVVKNRIQSEMGSATPFLAPYPSKGRLPPDADVGNCDEGDWQDCEKDCDRWEL